jgi:hypothetical protein
LETGGDPFTGTYRFNNAEQGAGYLVAKRNANGWYILFSIDGQSPPTPFPSPPTPSQLVLVTAHDLKDLFQEKSPLEQTSCLVIAPSGPAVICRMPVGASYQLKHGMSRPNMIESKTGYILIVGTPAGAMTFNMERTLDAGSQGQNEKETQNLQSQPLAFTRYTEELSSLLEQEAASAIARGMVTEAARTLCERVGGDVAKAVANEANAWRSRNEGYLTAATRVVEEIANRFLSLGGEGRKKSYLEGMGVEIEKIVNAGTRSRFSAANPNNTTVPTTAECMRVTSSLQSEQIDFRSTPSMTKALAPYMERKGLPGR